MKCISLFEQILGLKLSIEKTIIYFSKHIPDDLATWRKRVGLRESRV